MNIPMERIISELSAPGAYPHPVDRVRVIQTHISVVFLAGNRAYKIKKPVDFGFLDFTTLEKRLHFCREELRLNRRLSTGVYLRVAPVLDGPKGLEISGKEAAETSRQSAVEYAVVMERLDEDRLLSYLLRKGSVGLDDMDAVAQKIAHFHKHAETSADITNKGGTGAVVLNTEEDFQQIDPYIGDTITRKTFDRIVDYTRTFLDVNSALFEDRERAGWIRDGHGDLHTQHICMADPIQIFDCIEFNERFRYGDVLSDAAFLSMDLQMLGFTELAGRYIRTYLTLMEQEGEGGLINFYSCYRAVVRGKVEGFRSRDSGIGAAEAQTARSNARGFFHLAESYSRNLAPPVLVAGCGLMGSGKSSLAGALKSMLELVVLSSDLVRKELAGMAPDTRRHVPFGMDIYSKDFSDKTYSVLHEQALENLKEGRSVFLDASYATVKRRLMAAETARRAGAGFLLVYLDPGEEELRRRLRERKEQPGSVSDGREEIIDDQIAFFEPPAEMAAGQLLTLRGTLPEESAVRETYRRLLSTN